MELLKLGVSKESKNTMAHIGFYNGIDLIDTSSVLSANLEFNRDRVVAEAKDLANECDCEIEAWARDDNGDRTRHTSITVRPSK